MGAMSCYNGGGARCWNQLGHELQLRCPDAGTDTHLCCNWLWRRARRELQSDIFAVTDTVACFYGRRKMLEPTRRHHARHGAENDATRCWGCRWEKMQPPSTELRPTAKKLQPPAVELRPNQRRSCNYVGAQDLRRGRTHELLPKTTTELAPEDDHELCGEAIFQTAVGV